jgi:hypothetical protein
MENSSGSPFRAPLPENPPFMNIVVVTVRELRFYSQDAAE